MSAVVFTRTTEKLTACVKVVMDIVVHVNYRGPSMFLPT